MKKLSYLLIVFSIFILASCNSTTKPPFTTRAKNQSGITTSENNVKSYVNVMVESGEGFSVLGEQIQQVEVGSDAVFNIEILEGYHYLSNNSDGVFENGTLTIKNISTPRVVVIACEKESHIVKLKASEGLIIYDGDDVVENDKTAYALYNDDVSFKVGLLENYEYRGLSITTTDGREYDYIFENGIITIKNIKSDSEIMIQLRYVSPIVSETYYVSLKEDDAFTILGDNQQEINKGEDATFNIQVNSGYYYISNNCGATYDKGTITLKDVNGDQNIILSFGKTSTTTKMFDNGKMELYDGEKMFTYKAYPDNGYVFVSWLLDNNIYSYANYVYLYKTDYEELDLVPVFVKRSEAVLVSYNSNGGKIYNSSDKEVVYAFNSSVYKYPSAFGEWCHKTFYKDGYVPVEFNTMPDGSGTTYSLGSKILNDNKEIKLYLIWEKETNPNDFSYTYNQDDEGKSVSVTLTKYNGSEDTVVIPTTIDNLKVENISALCFENSEIKKVIITKEIKEVSKNAFKDCTKLETVYLSDSVNRIWDESFVNCANLKNLRMIAVLPPCFSTHLIATTARRFEYFYKNRETNKTYIVFYGGSSIFQGFDGQTMQNLFSSDRYAIVNGGQNAYVPGRLMLELYSKWMKENDIMVYVPEYSKTLFSDNFELPTWVALESYYDFLRDIDIRDYNRVFDSFYDFMNGSESYTIAPKLQKMSDGREETYEMFLDVVDEYFTRSSNFDFSKASIIQELFPPEFTTFENSLRNVINPLYLNVFAPKGIRIYMAAPTMWEDSFPGGTEQYQEFVNRIKEYILFPYISDVNAHLVSEDKLTDSISHLTPEAAYENSILLSQEIKYQMHLDGYN